MLTGSPSTESERSVPWSRSNPRRKNWLALPPPACCTVKRPGVTSRMSVSAKHHSSGHEDRPEGRVHEEVTTE
jgi:hypothetical protein